MMTHGQKSPPNYGPMLTIFSGVDEDLNDTIYEMDAMIFTASQGTGIHSSTMIRQLHYDSYYCWVKSHES